MSDREHELLSELLDAHEQLRLRDAVLQARDEEIRGRKAEIEYLTEENERLYSLTREMEATRAWRLGRRYWETRERIRLILRLGRDSSA